MINVGGIKLSPELAQFNLSGPSSAESSIVSCLKHMADCRINLTFLAMSQNDDATICNFCVSIDDSQQVRQVMKTTEPSPFQVEMLAPIGTITIFPHQRRSALLGKVIDSLTKAYVPIRAAGTSLSTLTINTDYHLLDRAVAELEKILDVPANHSPYRQEFETKTVD